VAGELVGAGVSLLAARRGRLPGVVRLNTRSTSEN
jgi:hypothetical protein